MFKLEVTDEENNSEKLKNFSENFEKKDWIKFFSFISDQIVKNKLQKGNSTSSRATILKGFFLDNQITSFFYNLMRTPKGTKRKFEDFEEKGIIKKLLNYWDAFKIDKYINGEISLETTKKVEKGPSIVIERTKLKSEKLVEDIPIDMDFVEYVNQRIKDKFYCEEGFILLAHFTQISEAIVTENIFEELQEKSKKLGFNNQVANIRWLDLIGLIANGDGSKEKIEDTIKWLNSLAVDYMREYTS